MVNNILDGIKEHAIERCEQEARRGNLCYTLRLKQGVYFIKDLLLHECIKMAKEFENNGYYISIRDISRFDSHYINFLITFSWDGDVVFGKFEDRRCLYDTKHGVLED